MDLASHEEAERLMGCEIVQFLLQLHEPLWSKVDVLQQHPRSTLSSSLDGLLGQFKTFWRTDCNSLVLFAHFCCEVLNLRACIISWSRAEEERSCALAFFLQFILINTLSFPSLMY